MADATTSLLIEIKTAMDAGALDVAKQKMTGLIDAQQKQADTERAQSQSQSQMLQAYRRSSEGIVKVQNSITDLTGVMDGADGAANRMGNSLQSIGSVGSKLGAYGLAAAAGWKLGNVLNDWFKLDQTFSDLINKSGNLENKTKGLGRSLADSRREIESANGATLERIIGQIDTAAESLNTMSDNATVARSHIDALAEAQTNLRMAEIDAMNISPAEKKIMKAELTDTSTSGQINRELTDLGTEANQMAQDRDKALEQKKYIETLMRSPMNQPDRKEAKDEIASIDAQISEYNKKLKAIQTREDVLMVNRQTTRVRSSSDIASGRAEIFAADAEKKADADEKAAKKKADDFKAKADIERERKEVEIERAKEAARQAEEAANAARGEADAYDPSTMQFRNRREERYARKIDAGLEGKAVSAEGRESATTAKVKELVEAFKAYDQNMNEQLDALLKVLQTEKSRNRNRP